MTSFETVMVKRDGAVALVTLNRPESLNAFDADLRRDLLGAVRQVNEDPLINVGVLTGAGRGFCAGADLNEPAADEPGFSVEDQLNEEYKPILMAIHDAPIPWLGAINGAAAGIGSAFAMNCDLVVMAESSFLYQAFAGIGLIPDGGATWHLVRSLGRHRAYEIIASGEKLAAQKCLQWGLCNQVVPDAELVSHTMSWAAELASKSPLALRFAKQALNHALNGTLDEAISFEAALQHRCITSADHKEGKAAFLEKREPRWKGC
ncbi:MAG: enoyl-CoA hydratase-related protein [Pseudomonadota bacterium]